MGNAVQGEGGLAARIDALIEPVAKELGFALVRVRFMGGKRARLQVMAERPDGTMSVEDCAVLSRAMSAVLDVEDPIRGEYLLEVSSPGIDRPLVKPEDFDRFSGHEARVELVGLLDGRKRFRGRLAGRVENDVLIETEAGPVRLPLALIDEAKLVLTDALVAEALRRQAKAAAAADMPSPDDPGTDRERPPRRAARKR